MRAIGIDPGPWYARLTCRRLAMLLPTIILAAAAAAAPASADASAAPTIELPTVSHITENDATLEARIDPEGLATSYEVFMFDPCNVPWECIAVGQVARGTISATANSALVSVNLAEAEAVVSMEPDASYKYWVVARNAAGTAESSEQTFKTLSASESSGPPAVFSESVSNVAESEATLEAQIDPDGFATTYEFWIEFPNCQSPADDFCESISLGPVGQGQIASGDTADTVSAQLTNRLHPGFSYSYWVVASNTAGHVKGGREEFTASELGSTPPSQGAAPPSVTAPPSAIEALTGAGDPALSGLPLAAGPRPPSPSLQAGAASTVSSAHLPKALTSEQKLVRALEACKKKPKKQRASCRKRAETKDAARATRRK
jgi:hypothetical protein